MIKSMLRTVTVIIPVFNEAEYISECLIALKNQNYPQQLLEIVVVDNGSTDDTVKIVSDFDVKVIRKSNCRVGAVRNYGVANCNSDILAFIDGDCVAGPNWLKRAVIELHRSDVGAVGGACLLRENPSWVEKGWIPARRCEDRQVSSLAGGSFILKKELFQTIGGFDENVNAGEDTMLSNRVKNEGLKLLFLKECYVVHLGYPRDSMGFFRREFWHASSYLKSNLGIKDKMFISVFLFLFSFISLVLFLLSGWVGFLLGGAFVVVSPLIFALKKYSGLPNSSITLTNILMSLGVYYLYYLGRSAGLFFSIFSNLSRKK